MTSSGARGDVARAGGEKRSKRAWWSLAGLLLVALAIAGVLELASRGAGEDGAPGSGGSAGAGGRSNAAVGSSRSPLAAAGLAAARAELADRSAASTAFGSARLRKALRAADALHLAVPANPLAPHRPDAEGNCPEPRFTDRPTPPAELPSSRLVAEELVARGVAVVSLVIEPCRLERLVAHPSGGGRRFEEPGWLSFYDRGELVWASAVGVRLHGGGSRTGNQDKSFRVYARPEWGEPSLPGLLLGDAAPPAAAGIGAGLGPDLAAAPAAHLPYPADALNADPADHADTADEATAVPEGEAFGAPSARRPGAGGVEQAPLDRVILHNDERLDRDGRRWHFLNPLAYEIGARLGALVPRTRPAWLVLNGEPVHVYVLTEHIADDFFARRFGAQPIRFVRGKGERDPADEARYQEARQSAVDLPAPLTMAAADEVFDVASLTRLFATIQLAATGDMFQSALAREEPDGAAREATRTARPGRWFLVHWDFDMSFRVPEQNPQHGWQKDLFRFVQKGPAGLNIPPRIVLWRLLAEDPAYRAEVARVLAGAMNHEVGPGWWAERLATLRADVERLGIADRAFLDELERFAVERPAVLREQIPQWLGTGPAYRVEVLAAGPATGAGDPGATSGDTGMVAGAATQIAPPSPPVRLRVDGRVVVLPWRGWLFGGQRLEVAAADGSAVACRELPVGVATRGTSVAAAAASGRGGAEGAGFVVKGPLRLACDLRGDL